MYLSIIAPGAEKGSLEIGVALRGTKVSSFGRQTSDRIVVYNATAEDYYIRMTLTSIRSLRKFNSKVPVRVFVYGSVHPKTKKKFKDLKVEVSEQVRPKSEADPFYLKWLSLKLVSQETVLAIDADTFFFDDVEKIFDSHQSCDFYARQEFGFEPYFSMCLIGTRVLATILDVKILDRIRRAMRAKASPVFNSGMILFNRWSHKRLIGPDDVLFETRQRFRKLRLPLPFPEPKMSEQILLSVALGRVKGLKVGFIDYQLAPFYIEWVAKVVRKPGVVIHTWGMYYEFALIEFRGRRALKELTPLAKYYGHYRPNGQAQRVR